MLVLVVWNYLFQPPAPPPPPAVESAALESAGEAVDPANSPQGPTAASDQREAVPSEGKQQVQAPTAEEAAARERVVGETEERYLLETASVRAEFTNRGAQLLSVRLKQHLDQQGEPLELIRERGQDPYPFSLVLNDRDPHPLNQALFVADRETDAEGRETLRFRHSSEEGVAEKRFSWRSEGLLQVEAEVLGRQAWGMLLGPGVRSDKNAKEENARWLLRMAAYRRSGVHETLEPAKQEADTELPASGLSWAALEDNFFLAAVIPESGVRSVLIRPVLQRATYGQGEPRFRALPTEAEDGAVREQALILTAQGERMAARTFMGAKQYSRLSELPYGLEETVRWGWFGFLARPLYHGLEWIYHKIVPNYGWAIVLITMVVKLLFFPLTHKSQQSMSKMQELNPKMQAIRNKFRGKLKDRQGRPNLDEQKKMNEEIMGLYKSAGVNPASGCFPILLQMPVFFALYRLLSTAVELRHAPWLGWIHDLSVPDPYYVLPIAMGVTSIALQKMMPESPDPMQRRMMQLMPIMFMFFAFAFPSGLVLYWLTNNLLSMAQQALTTKFMSKSKTAEA